MKVNKKMLKLINHVLSYKLTTRYKKLLEVNDEIGKGSVLIFDNKVETPEKNEDQKELEPFVCHVCGGIFGSSEIRYQSIDGDFYLCEKCEVDCFNGIDFIKIKPDVKSNTIVIIPTSSGNLYLYKTICITIFILKIHLKGTMKPKNSIRKSETLSLSTTSESWSNSSMNLSNRINEIKAKLVNNPQPITAPPDTKIYQFIEVLNSGTLKWPNNVYLVCVSGEYIDEFKEVPSLEKNGKYEISLTLESPSKVGKYYSAWRLSHNQEGEENCRKFFGPRITFEINVESNDIKKINKKINTDQGILKSYGNQLYSNTSSGFKFLGKIENIFGFKDFKIYNECNKATLKKAEELHKYFTNHDVAYFVEFLKKSKDRDKSVQEIVDLNKKLFQN